MNVYSIDFPIYATAYIKAGSQEAAIEIAKRALAGRLVNETDGESEVEFSDTRFGDPSLPAVSVSPAMTIAPSDRFDDAFVECVEVNVADGEDA